MSTIPKAQFIIGFTEFFNVEPPNDRLSIIKGICKLNLITEIAALNYRLKPKNTKYHNTTLKNQISELQLFCGLDQKLFIKYANIAQSFTRSAKDYPLIFIRQSCNFALEEIIQSNLEEIEDFVMARIEVWDAIFKYLLAVNTKISQIKEEEDKDLINFEILNPKMLPLNELNVIIDPFHIPYRGYKLLEYLSSNGQLKDSLKAYLANTYSLSYQEFIYNILNIYFGNKNTTDDLNFYYIINDDKRGFFEGLSKVYKSQDLFKLLSVKKYPFYKRSSNHYILIDNTLLIEKAYTQFINDFWFDFIKPATKKDGTQLMDIQNYKSIIGLFFENYVKSLIDFSFANARHYTIKCFEELKLNRKGGENEITDLYIRFNSKIILGEVKSTSIYDAEKFGGTIDALYKNDRNQFFSSFGLDQLVNAIVKLDETIIKIDEKFPANKTYQIFPVIVINENALQTPIMNKIFQDRFLELIKDYKNHKVHVYPLTIIHIGDLENIQDHILENPHAIWNLLKFHCRNPQFMPPFFNSINRKDINSKYSRSKNLYESIISKYSKT